ncbi:DUF1146 family protein [Listeria booriae]|uniref:DUF1146 domain-containing protein n=1 Tax=Listeria booriae TaxID=1552123 RepID=A0A842AJX6_9LIST|nr:DUF1146 family protein [Listeria booriae]MBC1401275.1 DUF1146 domain-containing protein [Listeria booriae]MBC1616288.1 DUF1146 domain-containing protein [Listeria booriae]MBC2320303.1 DUF1146 domain-containing protein [Listeria booriae]
MYTVIGQQAIIVMISHLLFIVITFWALQALNFEKLIRRDHVIQARVLYLIIAVALGVTISNFFLDYFISARQLGNLLGN